MIVSCFYFIQQILCLFFFICTFFLLSLFRLYFVNLLLAFFHTFTIFFTSWIIIAELDWTKHRNFSVRISNKMNAIHAYSITRAHTIPFASRFNELVWHILALCTCRDDAANVFMLKGFNGYFDICKYRCMLQYQMPYLYFQHKRIAINIIATAHRFTCDSFEIVIDSAAASNFPNASTI